MGLEEVSFHSSPQEGQYQRMFKLPYNCAHITCWQGNAKSFKLGFSTTWTENFQMYKLGLEKAVLCLVTQSCLTVCNPVDCNPPGYSVHRDSPGKNTGLGCYALLQGILPTQGSHPGLLHCTAFSLLSESPVKPKNTGGGSLSLPSLGDSWAKNQTRVSCIAGWSLQTATREAQKTRY